MEHRNLGDCDRLVTWFNLDRDTLKLQSDPINNQWLGLVNKGLAIHTAPLLPGAPVSLCSPALLSAPSFVSHTLPAFCDTQYFRMEYKVQTCQVTLISRVRPAFWPVNQHSLDENLN